MELGGPKVYTKKKKKFETLNKHSFNKPSTKKNTQNYYFLRYYNIIIYENGTRCLKILYVWGLLDTKLKTKSLKIKIQKNITKHHMLLLKTKLKKKKNYKTSMTIRVDCCVWCCVCQMTTFSFIKEYKLGA